MIHILLSTYNGSRFLKNQIDSILHQTLTQWRLFIRDDGSTDSTIDIIKDYTKAYSNKIIYIEDHLHLGSCLSFLHLLFAVPSAEYYAFCDQDDIWKTDKLEICLQHIQQYENKIPNGKNIPVLVHTDLQVVDENLNTIALSFWKYNDIRPTFSLSDIHYLAIRNCITGCTTLMNHAVLKCLDNVSQHIFMHDAWIGLNVMKAGGTILSLPNTTILYRQHQNNLLGAEEHYPHLHNFTKKITDLKHVYHNAKPLVFHSVLDLLYWKMKCVIKILLQ